MFFVYENWTNTFAKVHRGDCVFCNHGHGFQGEWAKPRGSPHPCDPFGMANANGNAPEIVEHLEFIQAVIARLAGASALLKAWCLTVATATLGYAWTKNADEVAWVAIFAVAMFAFLDVHYLREERKYRALYKEARLGKAGPYDMDARPCGERRNPRYNRECGWWPTVRSWSVWAFYGPILILAVVVWTTNSAVTDDHSKNSLRINSHASSFASSE